MILINFKLIAHKWKKISLVAFLATLFLFFAGGNIEDSMGDNIVVFVFMFIGLFIGVNIFWSAGSAVWEFVSVVGPKKGKDQPESLPTETPETEDEEQVVFSRKSHKPKSK